MPGAQESLSARNSGRGAAPAGTDLISLFEIACRGPGCCLQHDFVTSSERSPTSPPAIFVPVRHRARQVGKRPRADTHRAAPCGSSAMGTGHHGRTGCRDVNNSRHFLVWPRQTTPHAHSAPSNTRSAPFEMAYLSPDRPGPSSSARTRRSSPAPSAGAPARVPYARRQPPVPLDFRGAAGKAANLGGRKSRCRQLLDSDG